mmetsp:Transcript_8098/g.20084  ORF Transcript_8098/g.20084 Transcript_8098/m.20084 type:complete len:85 (-) Transcript_8098:1060-1314(-)
MQYSAPEQYTSHALVLSSGSHVELGMGKIRRGKALKAFNKTKWRLSWQTCPAPRGSHAAIAEQLHSAASATFTVEGGFGASARP